MLKFANNIFQFAHNILVLKSWRALFERNSPKKLQEKEVFTAERREERRREDKEREREREREERRAAMAGVTGKSE